METRKIQKVGHRSYSLSLPKEWVIGNNLKEQETVFIDRTDNNELLIRAGSASLANNDKLTVNIDKIDNISEFIVFCYVKNLNHLVLHSKQLVYEKIREVRKVLKYLEGYDITSEDTNRIEISFLFNDININIQKIIQRMTYLLMLNVESLKNKDYSTLEETETNIDRLYHLSKRIIFACMKNHNLRKVNRIASEEDLFFYTAIVKRLENLSDNLVRLQSHELNDTDFELLEKHMQFLSDVLVKKAELAKHGEFVNHHQVDIENKDIQAVLARIHELCRDVYENTLSIEFNREYF